MTLLLTASSFYSIFKTLNSTVALQVGFLEHLGDVATVLVDWVGLSLLSFFMSLQTDWMQILNALSYCHVIGWLAICVTKQLNRYLIKVADECMYMYIY